MTEPSFAAQLAEDLGPDDLRHVLEVFGLDVARLTGVLEEAAAGDDAIGFRRAAHGLAGAAGAVGAAALEQQCRQSMAQMDTDAADLTATMRAIAVLAEDALRELARFVATLDRQPPHSGA